MLIMSFLTFIHVKTAFRCWIMDKFSDSQSATPTKLGQMSLQQQQHALQSLIHCKVNIAAYHHILDFHMAVDKLLESFGFHIHNFPPFVLPSILVTDSFLEDNPYLPCCLACSVGRNSYCRNFDFVGHFAEQS